MHIEKNTRGVYLVFDWEDDAEDFRNNFADLGFCDEGFACFDGYMNALILEEY